MDTYNQSTTSRGIMNIGGLVGGRRNSSADSSSSISMIAPATTTTTPTCTTNATTTTMRNESVMIPSFPNSEHKVTHHYHDHSNDPDGDYDVQQQIAQKTGGPGAEQSFPMKLHYMLNDIEQDNLSHIVSWMPHGRCFVVHNQRLFVERILGCWFRQSKIASFQRQLNIYGFQRLTTGPDKNGYYHELFLRGKPGLAARIQRQKLKGTKTRRAASPESEPNFYAMTPMPANRPKQPQVMALTTCGGAAGGGVPTKAVPASSVLAAATSAAAAAAAGGLPAAATAATTTGSTSPPLSSSPSLCATSSNALTLQKIAPSLFSPATFETTVHLVPQTQSRQHGLMVTSTCSLTLKPTEEAAAAAALVASGAAAAAAAGTNPHAGTTSYTVTKQFPLATHTWTFQGPPRGGSAPNNTNHVLAPTTTAPGAKESFWAALRGSTGGLGPTATTTTTLPAFSTALSAAQPALEAAAAVAPAPTPIVVGASPASAAGPASPLSWLTIRR